MVTVGGANKWPTCSVLWSPGEDPQGARGLEGREVAAVCRATQAVGTAKAALRGPVCPGPSPAAGHLGAFCGDRS